MRLSTGFLLLSATASALSLPAGYNSNVATLHSLASYAVPPFNARCLDGSPYEIWVHLATPGSPNANKWVIDLEGGAWCMDLPSCAARAYTPTACDLGSSNASCFNSNSLRCANKSESMQFSCLPACNGARWCGGLFTNSSATNPLTHDWNQVYMPYKSGDSRTGDMAHPVMTTFNGASVPLYFRGKANFLAAVDYLLHTLGMAQAEEVGLTGNSAGGLATLYHADTLAALLPASVRTVWAAPDSGFFIASVAAYPAWRRALLGMMAMSNGTSALPPACLAAVAAAGGDPATCAFPEVLAPHLTTPLFLMNSRYDPALDSISGGESGSNASNVNALGRQLLDTVKATVLGPGRRNAAFITGCHEHCGQWAQGSDGDFNSTIGGLAAVPALKMWRDSGFASQLWVQAPGDSYPCADCCTGGL